MSPETELIRPKEKRSTEIIRGLGLVAVGLLYGAFFVRFGVVNKNIYSAIVGAVGVGTGIALSAKHFIEAHRLKPQNPKQVLQ